MRPLLAALALLLASGAGAQSTATLRGIDVYRSARLSDALAEELYGAKLREMVGLRNLRLPAMDAKAEELRRQVERLAAAFPGVAFAALHLSQHYSVSDNSVYATFDVVDEADRDRLAFSPAPRLSVKDPGGLLAAWRQFDELGTALAKRGRMPVDRPDCPGFYCSWAAVTPELGALQKKLSEGAGPRAQELRQALVQEADGGRRAAALYALSYAPSGERLVEDCLRALRDPDERVRAAALQILADAANHRKELKVDAARVVAALDDPRSAIRAKAMGLLVAMADDRAQRAVLLSAAPRLAALLRLRQPESRDLAFTVLSLLSRKDFDRADQAAWEKWAAEAAAGAKR